MAGGGGLAPFRMTLLRTPFSERRRANSEKKKENDGTTDHTCLQTPPYDGTRLNERQRSDTVLGTEISLDKAHHRLRLLGRLRGAHGPVTSFVDLDSKAPPRRAASKVAFNVSRFIWQLWPVTIVQKPRTSRRVLINRKAAGGTG